MTTGCCSFGHKYSTSYKCPNLRESYLIQRFSVHPLYLLLLITENGFIPGVIVLQSKPGKYDTKSTIKYNTLQ